MKVAIITDTHDRREIIANACDIFTQQRVDYVLHAGDITSPATARMLAHIPRMQLIAVFGNCDYDKVSLQQAIAPLGGEIHPGLLKTEVEGKKLAMAHDPYNLGSSAGNGRFDLVVYGHTHEQDIRTNGSTLVVNPGAGQAVIVELDDMTHEIVSLRRRP